MDKHQKIRPFITFRSYVLSPFVKNNCEDRKVKFYLYVRKTSYKYKAMPQRRTLHDLVLGRSTRVYTDSIPIYGQGKVFLLGYDIKFSLLGQHSPALFLACDARRLFPFAFWPYNVRVPNHPN